MRRGRYNLNDYDDDDDFPWYAKGLLVALLCGAVWLLVTFVR